MGWFIILIKSSLCLTICFIFYLLVVKRISDFGLRRFYLMAILIISHTLPFIHIEIPSRYQAIGERLLPLQVSEEQLLYPIARQVYSYPQVNDALQTSYLIVVGLLTILTLISLTQIVRMIYQNDKTDISGQRVIFHGGKQGPFSFLKWLFMPKNISYNDKSTQTIIKHEQVHIQQNHSVDILFVRLFQIIHWFNPIMYFLKREIELNLEFITDREVCKSISKKEYVHLLMNFHVARGFSLTGQFAGNSLKNRVYQLSSNFYFKKIFIPLLTIASFLIVTFNVTAFTSFYLEAERKTEIQKPAKCKCPDKTEEEEKDEGVIKYKDGKYGAIVTKE
ncbi:M56 family metallopeptidase [Reichenbachiella ulvae]|uniref:Peptidase M56 domain-containing protein n=1 Tax=Reichenbachiella ulvae TaxID=2980104 RepID=A0ABT3CTL8_9BACT|nr:M56 family metallopeptidase [Reichenbachiella ulvae]MCV9387050.1 hypothetical protein [Reichenbachiella ulvae]